MKGERARLFVALELPVREREQLARWCSSETRHLPGLRALAPETLHVTLCFLGWRTVPEIEAIGRACRVLSSQERVELSLKTALWLPARRPRVLAIGLEDLSGRLTLIRSMLSDALQAGGWYDPPGGRFMAHVTVGRISRGIPVGRPALAPAPALSFRASLVTVFRSLLGPDGARYEKQCTIQLR